MFYIKRLTNYVYYNIIVMTIKINKTKKTGGSENEKL